MSSACVCFHSSIFLLQEDTCLLLEDFYERNITADSFNCPGKLTDLLFIRGGPWPGTLDGRNVTNYFDDFSMIVFPCVPVMRAYPIVMSWGSLHRACRCEASVWDLKTAHRHTHTYPWQWSDCWQLVFGELKSGEPHVILSIHSTDPCKTQSLWNYSEENYSHYKTALRLFLGCKACLHPNFLMLRYTCVSVRPCDEEPKYAWHHCTINHTVAFYLKTLPQGEPSSYVLCHSDGWMHSNTWPDHSMCTINYHLYQFNYIIFIIKGH